eukprot:1161417-Pelagomonas_calceolata.AAC.8
MEARHSCQGGGAFYHGGHASSNFGDTCESGAEASHHGGAAANCRGHAHCYAGHASDLSVKQLNIVVMHTNQYSIQCHDMPYHGSDARQDSIQCHVHRSLLGSSLLLQHVHPIYTSCLLLETQSMRMNFETRASCSRNLDARGHWHLIQMLGPEKHLTGGGHPPPDKNGCSSTSVQKQFQPWNETARECQHVGVSSFCTAQETL